MKTTTAIIFAMTAGMTVNAAAIADQFNDRGPEFNAGVSSTADAPRESGKFVSYGFVKGNQI